MKNYLSEFLPDDFKSRSPEERRKLISAISEFVEVRKLPEFLTEDEMITIRESFSDDFMKVSDLRDQIKDFTKTINEQINPLKKTISANITLMKKKYRENEKPVYAIANQELGMMEFYDENAVMIESRRLTQAERQERISTPVLKLNQAQ